MISKGDLVMVVRGHDCIVAKLGGIPFRVEKLVPQRGGGWSCSVCGGHSFHPEAMWGAGSHLANAVPLSCLKKIDPPSELEGVDEKETLYA